MSIRENEKDSGDSKPSAMGQESERNGAAHVPTPISNSAISEDPEAALRALATTMIGQRLPSERELAERLKISRPNLRSILAKFQKEGLVESRPKSGTYVVDHNARALQVIVLLIDGDLKLNDDPFIHTLMDSVQRAVQATGARCLIERTSGNGRRAGFDEGVLTLGLAGHALIASQKADDPPMVGLLLNATARPNQRASVFQLDDQDAGRTAATRLIEGGCKEIVFVGREDIPASRERLTGAEEVAKQHDVALRFISSHLSYAAGIRTGRSLHLGDSKMSVGIIATNDWLALGLRMGLREAHEPAERDTKIVSFDGLSVTKEPSLGIESLAVPLDEIAVDAVDELQRLHKSPTATGRIIRYALR